MCKIQIVSSSVRNSSQKWRRYVEKYIPMSLVKNKNTSYNLYIYSITYTNWVIIKQEGKNKLKQNSIPSLVPGPHFLSIFLRCFLYFVLRSLSISLQRKQVHAHVIFLLSALSSFLPRWQPFSNIRQTLQRRHPTRLPPKPFFLNASTALGGLILVVSSYGSICH